MQDMGLRWKTSAASYEKRLCQNELEEGFFSNVFEFHEYSTKIFLNCASSDFIMIKSVLPSNI